MNIPPNYHSIENNALIEGNYEPPSKKVKYNSEENFILEADPIINDKALSILPFQESQNISDCKPITKRKAFRFSDESANSSSEDVGDNTVWDEALLEAEQAGNTDPLVKLFQSELVDDIDENLFDDIFDYGLKAKKREVIFECAKFGLPEICRYEALKFALKTKTDFELTKFILDGTKGQKPLNINALISRNIFELDYYIDLGVDAKIINLLRSRITINKSVLEEAAWRSCLANIWGLHGKFSLDGMKAEYQGSYIHFFIDKILSSIQSCNFETPGRLDENLFEILYQLIDESRNSIEEKLRTYKEDNKFFIVHGGLNGHHMELVLCGTFLLICNKGLLSDVPVEVYSINSKLVNSGLIEKIQKGASTFTLEEAEIFYEKTLPDLLEGVPHEKLIYVLNKNWIDKSLDQTRENCVWESIRTAMFGVAGLNAWINNDCENESSLSVQEATICEAYQEVQLWDKYVGLWGLGEYLNDSAKDSSKLDHRLVKAILKKAERRIKSGLVNEKQYKTMLTKYDQATTKKRELIKI